MFSEFTFRGEGGSAQKDQRFTFFIDIELWTQSLMQWIVFECCVSIWFEIIFTLIPSAIAFAPFRLILFQLRSNDFNELFSAIAGPRTTPACSANMFRLRSRCVRVVEFWKTLCCLLIFRIVHCTRKLRDSLPIAINCELASSPPSQINNTSLIFSLLLCWDNLYLTFRIRSIFVKWNCTAKIKRG